MKLGHGRWILTALLLAACTLPTRLDLSPGSGHWQALAALPVARADMGVAVIKQKLYAVGGATTDKPNSERVEMYDPKQNRWSSLAPLPTGMSHVAMVAWRDRLYVFGGFTAVPHANAQALAYMYDPARNAWQSLPPLSVPRGSITAVVLNEQIHLLGGRGLDKKTLAIHEVFDPRTLQYTLKTPLSVARDHVGTAVLAGRLHVFGGRTDGPTDNLGLHEVYDAAKDAWERLAPLPTARSDGATLNDERLAVYAGGECTASPPSRGKTFAQVEAYVAADNRWLGLAPLPGARHSFQGALVDGRWVLVGGFRGCAGADVTDEVWALSW